MKKEKDGKIIFECNHCIKNIDIETEGIMFIGKSCYHFECLTVISSFLRNGNSDMLESRCNQCDKFLKEDEGDKYKKTYKQVGSQFYCHACLKKIKKIMGD